MLTPVMLNSTYGLVGIYLSSNSTIILGVLGKFLFFPDFSNATGLTLGVLPPGACYHTRFDTANTYCTAPRLTPSFSSLYLFSSIPPSTVEHSNLPASFPYFPILLLGTVLLLGVSMIILSLHQATFLHAPQRRILLPRVAGAGILVALVLGIFSMVGQKSSLDRIIISGSPLGAGEQGVGVVGVRLGKGFKWLWAAWGCCGVSFVVLAGVQYVHLGEERKREVRDQEARIVRSMEQVV